MYLHSYLGRAIRKNQLKLVGGRKEWRKYYLNITELVWARNLHDGHQIDVFEKESGDFLERIVI